MNILDIIDLEKDLRDIEKFLSLNVGREMNCLRNGSWFDLMEGIELLNNGRFLSIYDILNKTKDLDLLQRTFILESVCCGLSELKPTKNIN